jgi:uncharacterized protein YdcH (DUF465 family)
MSTTPREFQSILIDQDPEFQRLAAEHTRCDAQLQSLHGQTYLSSEDMILEVTLKKIKLRLKDQMGRLLDRRRRETELH